MAVREGDRTSDCAGHVWLSGEYVPPGGGQTPWHVHIPVTVSAKRMAHQHPDTMPHLWQ